MSDDEDIPQLSADTLAALSNFQAEQQQKIEELKAGKIEKVDEDWQLRVAASLASSERPARIACVSSPTLVQFFHERKEYKSGDIQLSLFEYDSRFGLKFPSEFVQYDYKYPTAIPPELVGIFDVIIADPPFLAAECLIKTAHSIRLLGKESVKVILCTGAIMEDYAARLLAMHRTSFEPKHANNLANDFSCFANYPTITLLSHLLLVYFMAPTGQGGQWQEVLCCTVCTRHFNEIYLPVSLICGHVICCKCAEKPESQTKPCPHDDWKVTISPKEYPTNVALLSVIFPRKPCISFSGAKTDDEKRIDQLAIRISQFFREADSERGGTVSSRDISRTLQKKVLALLCYQWAEPDGRMKMLKMSRGICERVMIEIILSIQSNTHVSSQLWSAVRSRGCQFLGPAMQDDVLRLILMTLETGECIARKNLVMYVVQTLGSDYPQVSKTCVGHVVQLLYRASCFNVLKRDGESSLMQLKDEFRTYEALRREHDSQIVQIAFESGLRIGPDQWSALLYADQSHRSHMQSIIDKLQSRNSIVQGIDELRALAGSTTSNLVPAYRYFLGQVIPCLEFFINPDYEEATESMVAKSLEQVRLLLKLHCSQDELRKNPREDRRVVLPPGMGLPQMYPAPPIIDPPRRNRTRTIPYKANLLYEVDEQPTDPVKSQVPVNSQKTSSHPNPSPPQPPQTPQQQQPQQQAVLPPQQFTPRQKRYQMGIPPQRVGYLPPQHQYPVPPNFYPMQPPPMHQQRFKGRRGPPRGAPMPMFVGFAPDMGMMPSGPPPPLMPVGDDSSAPRQVMIMQSPTHMSGAPVVMIPQQAMGPPPSVTPVPMGSMTPQLPVQWTTTSPTGSVIYPASSPPGQAAPAFWIQSTEGMFPMFDSGGLIWGPTTMLRESGADAEQLLAKRHEILKRLHPSEDDDDGPEDGGIGHVSYTVASSVLDDRMDHHPMAMMPVPTIDLPAIPINFSNIPTDETMTMIGEMVQNRPRAPSITGSTAGTSTVVPATVQSECAATVPPNAIPMVQAVPVVPVVQPETFNPSVPPPQPGQPMLVDSATGLLTPMRPILVAYPQNVVSNSLDKIVDVKERLSEAQGCASEAENAHLRMELRMAESEMAHLDPYTKNNCLLRELQQVDRELQQLQIEPIRQ
ncbi:unnamed protein product [Caenorhabditis sp. 36 PRJEB53466]|nr:unnamed protein product [Caenorhabditis sp. 36 PRJEB53466]